MQKHLVIAILVLGITLCVILILIALVPSVGVVAGGAHSMYTSMSAGGDGAARINSIATLAFIFQVVVLAQFACFVALGVAEHRRNLNFYLLMSGCYLLAVFVWWKIFSAHQQFLTTGETGYFLGFPTATAWVVYGVYLAGVSFIAVYVFGFKKFIWSEQDQAAFQRLLDEHNN
jgi:hypothetical protein